MANKLKPLLFSTIFSLSTLSPALAHEDGVTKLIRPDSHAPIGVMADHMHKKGEWMLGYRMAHMSMSGLIDGTNDITANDVAMMPNPNGNPAKFRMVPEKMDMTMHMFGLMYAPSDKVTLVLGGSAISKEMTMLTYQGMMGTTELGKSTAKTAALNAIKTTALVRLFDENGKHLHVGLGLSAPLGSINETGEVLMPTGQTMTNTLAYGMQTGTGTWDISPSITYTQAGQVISYGAQYSGRMALGKNNAGYRFGNQHDFNGWVSALVHESVSLSLRLNYATSGAIVGQDARIMGATPGAVPAMQGRDAIKLGFGANYVFQSGALKGHRIAAEYIVPLYEDTNGPQLKLDHKLVIGWQYAF